MKKRITPGFTLIELLVVIAIIAILAAILFPVFAQAREKARQVQCLSNAKQLGTAVAMYNQDYDELMPRFRTTAEEDAIPRNRLTALWLCYPYIKNNQMYKCPNMPDATSAGFSVWGTRPDRPTWPTPSNMSIWMGYGWNVDYMNFSQNCSDYHNGINNESGPPTPLARINKPSETIMAGGAGLAAGSGSFMGANSLYPQNGGYYYLLAPATLTTPEGCVWSNGGWGQGSFMGAFGGFEQPRHGNMGGNLTFVDGHSKFMTAGRVAGGTNWTPETTNNQIQVIDRNQYMWDLE